MFPFGHTSRLPKRALNVRARSKLPVGELTLDLAVGVEMEYIDALPTYPVSDDQTNDDFLEGHNQPSRFAIVIYTFLEN